MLTCCLCIEYNILHNNNWDLIKSLLTGTPELYKENKINNYNDRDAVLTQGKDVCCNCVILIASLLYSTAITRSLVVVTHDLTNLLCTCTWIIIIC